MRLLLIVDPCDGGVLNSEAACFQNLSRAERDAAIVWYLWQAAQACASYSSDLNTLLADASCFAVQSEEMLHAMEVLIAGELASDAGASVSITMAEVVEGIKCIKNVDAQKIRALKVLLTCKLNACVGGIS